LVYKVGTVSNFYGLFLFLLEARAVGAKNYYFAYEALFEAARVAA
jgi:hypothetical protein